MPKTTKLYLAKDQHEGLVILIIQLDPTGRADMGPPVKHRSAVINSTLVMQGAHRLLIGVKVSPHVLQNVRTGYAPPVHYLKHGSRARLDPAHNGVRQEINAALLFSGLFAWQRYAQTPTRYVPGPSASSSILNVQRICLLLSFFLLRNGKMRVLPPEMGKKRVLPPEMGKNPPRG